MSWLSYDLTAESDGEEKLKIETELAKYGRLEPSWLTLANGLFWATMYTQ